MRIWRPVNNLPRTCNHLRNYGFHNYIRPQIPVRLHKHLILFYHWFLFS